MPTLKVRVLGEDQSLVEALKTVDITDAKLVKNRVVFTPLPKNKMQTLNGSHFVLPSDLLSTKKFEVLIEV